jgi:PAS domain S-box-containing protein
MAADFASGLRTALARICGAAGWTVGEAWTVTPEGTSLVLNDAWGADDRATAFSRAARAITPGGVADAAWKSRRPAWSEDARADASFVRRDAAEAAGLQATFAIPVVVDDETIAVLQLFTRESLPYDEQLVALVSAVAVELGSIMQRRRVEGALRDSEGTIRSLFEYAPDAIVAVDRTGRIVQANLQAEAMFGYNRDELEGRSVEVLLPQRLREAHSAHRAAFSREPRRRPMGAGLRLVGVRKEGTEFPVDITLTPVEDRADGVVMAVARDTTERREAQRRFRRLLESAPDAMIIVGPDMRIILVNGHAERLFGHARQDLIRQPATLLIPPRFRHAAVDGLNAFFREPRMMHLGDDGQPSVHGLRKDGHELPLQVTMSPLDTEVGMLAIVAIRDLTERREAEQQREILYREIHASRERLAALSMRLLATQESERRTIARELHDEIGQALTAVSVNLQNLLQGAPDAPDRAEVLEESMAITQQTLRQVRDLSLNLRPSLLDDLGLGPALRWYLERQGQRLGLTIELEDGLDDVRYPAPVETTCFRVAQEAVTNVVRHANAQAVRVALRRNGTRLELVIQDDGDGFDVSAARNRASQGHSMGLLGMGGARDVDRRPPRHRVLTRMRYDGDGAFPARHRRIGMSGRSPMARRRIPRFGG